jgi:hypothetical protein
MSDDLAKWDEHRKKNVNLARAETLQKALEEIGYFRIPWPHTPHPTMKEPIPAQAGLVYLLVDYLHIADKERQFMDLPRFQELVQYAYSLFEKEPRFPLK